MKEEYKTLVVVLSDKLELNSLKFIGKYDSSLKTDGDTINLIISAHLSSLFTLIRNISEHNNEAKYLVNDFIKNILEAVAKSKAITGMEVVENV